MRRVVVTGMGVVSSIGRDLKEIWGKLGSVGSGLAEVGKGDLGGFGFRVSGKGRVGRVEVAQSELEGLTVSDR